MIKLNLANIRCGDFAEVKKLMTIGMTKNFANISEDFNPIHLDEKYASKSRYKKKIIHGLMAVSLFSGLFGTKLPGEGSIYKSQNIRFKRPIYIGDTVLARIEVTSVDYQNKIISFKTQCKVNKKIMIDGESEIFLP